jgi:hypothetical protein
MDRADGLTLDLHCGLRWDYGEDYGITVKITVTVYFSPAPCHGNVVLLSKLSP